MASTTQKTPIVSYLDTILFKSDSRKLHYPIFPILSNQDFKKDGLYRVQIFADNSDGLKTIGIAKTIGLYKTTYRELPYRYCEIFIERYTDFVNVVYMEWVEKNSEKKSTSDIPKKQVEKISTLPLKNMESIGFSEPFPKLLDYSYLTIRTYRLEKNTELSVFIKKYGYCGKVKVGYCSERKVSEIDTKILMYDTNTNSREEAMKVLSKYNIFEDTIVAVIRLQWLMQRGFTIRHALKMEGVCQ
jgi:hypothetical protein